SSAPAWASSGSSGSSAGSSSVSSGSSAMRLPGGHDLGRLPNRSDPSEAGDRGLHVVVDLEHRVELGHLEELANLGAGAEELGLAPLLLRLRQRPHQSSEARAVEKAHARKIHEQTGVALLEQPRDGLLEGRFGVADDEVSRHGQDRYGAVFMSLKFHGTGALCQKPEMSGAAAVSVQNRRGLSAPHLIPPARSLS